MDWASHHYERSRGIFKKLTLDDTTFTFKPLQDFSLHFRYTWTVVPKRHTLTLWGNDFLSVVIFQLLAQLWLQDLQLFIMAQLVSKSIKGGEQNWFIGSQQTSISLPAYTARVSIVTDTLKSWLN